MTSPRTYSEYTAEAVLLIGQLIRIERKRRRWSEAELAERVGVARETLKRIERGEPTCAVGLVFEAATIVGVPLFEADRSSLRVHLERSEALLALLPNATRSTEKAVDDDF